MFKIIFLLPSLLFSSPALAQGNDQNLYGSWHWSHELEGLTATLSFTPDSLEIEIVFEVNDPHVWRNYVEGIGDTVDVSGVDPISSLSLYSSSPYTTENGMISPSVYRLSSVVEWDKRGGIHCRCRKSTGIRGRFHSNLHGSIC